LRCVFFCGGKSEEIKKSFCSAIVLYVAMLFVFLPPL
jgi:hypothetical protein